MSCTDDRDRIESYLDDALEPEARAELESHLRDCPACAARVRAERRIREHVAAAVDEVAPAALRARVQEIVSGAPAAVHELRRWSEIERAAPARVGALAGGRRRMGVGLTAGLALAASVAVLVGLWLVAPRPSVQQGWAADLAADHSEHHGPTGKSFLNSEADAAQLGRWFASSHDVQAELPTPPPGARLLGGQLCFVNGRWVAHAVYELENRVVVSYFVLPEVPGFDGMDGRVGALRYLGWDTPQGGAVVVGRAPAAELARAFSRG